MSTAAYRDVENLSARAIGELFDGRLHAQPRPDFPHAYAHSMVGGELVNPFHRGVGGPGGWISMLEEWVFKGGDVVIVDEPAGNPSQTHHPYQRLTIAQPLIGWM